MTQDSLAASSGPTTRRRTILKGAAWSVPVVATGAAVPAASASEACVVEPVTFDWDQNFARTNKEGGTGTLTTSDGRVITVTVASVGSTAVRTANDNLQVGSGQLFLTSAGLSGHAATDMTTYDTDYDMTTTITFSEPVEGLRFTVWDIDKLAATVERLTVTPATATPTPGANIELDPASGVNCYWNKSEGDGSTTNPANAVVYDVSGTTTSFSVTLNRAWKQAQINSSGFGLSSLEFTTVCP